MQFLWIGIQVVEFVVTPGSPHQLVRCRANHGGPADGVGTLLLLQSFRPIDAAPAPADVLRCILALETVRFMGVVSAFGKDGTIRVALRSVKLRQHRVCEVSMVCFDTG